MVGAGKAGRARSGRVGSVKARSGRLAKPSPRTPPTLRYEREVWRSGAGLLAAVDEVGRGALAGPVSVGVVLLAADTKPAPLGVADSKLLTAQARQRLVPRIRRWALDCAVGHASAADIDQIGIMAALRLAAERAMSQLVAAPDWVLLDGNYDYLTPRQLAGAADQPSLFEELAVDPEAGRWRCSVPVHTLIKGDMRCSSIAAASVLAKTERDGLLIELAEQYPAYGFADNKAYASPQHLSALLEHGPSPIHRCSWNLPGLIDRAGQTELALDPDLDGDPDLGSNLGDDLSPDAEYPALQMPDLIAGLTDELAMGDDGEMTSARPNR